MSYFADNPEKWDEIELRGVADFILSHDPNRDEDELLERLEEIQYGSPDTWRQMTRDAQRYISSREQDYWGDMADAYLARAEQ